MSRNLFLRGQKLDIRREKINPNIIVKKRRK
jgi:hypothetical protein